MTPSGEVGSNDSQTSPGIVGGVKPDKRKYRRQLGEDGKPKKNFYNPPGKVMRHLAQQSYYDSFYGNQGQFYTLKQKFKTQMCKHFLNNGECPLNQYCQFAHGPSELRQSNDVSLFELLILTLFCKNSHCHRTLERQLLVQYTQTTKLCHARTF